MFSPIWPAADREARGAQLVVQFGVDEVHLAEIRLDRVTRDPRAVLHRHAQVRVALDAEPDAAAGSRRGSVCHRVRGAAADCGDDPRS